LNVAATSNLVYVLTGDIGGIEELAKNAAGRLAHRLIVDLLTADLSYGIV
jgi:hypothetical protein